MSAQKASRSAASRSGGERAAGKPKAARSGKETRPKAAKKTAGGKAASAAKAAASKGASKSGNAPSRPASRTKAPAARKKGFAAGSASAKAASGRRRPSGGFVKRAVCACARSYALRFTAVLAVVVAVAFVAASAFSAQSNERPAQRADGLPVYITDEMIDTARAMRHEYGHPAGCTIAQIIQESGQGTSLSMLAERDNNLFGMKWADSFSGKHGVVGPVQWNTDEEYDGETVSVKDAFIEFESKKACIEFRSSVFLQSSTYANNPTIARAIETNNSALMAWGLQDAGWATDSSYAEHLVSIMDSYDLYRFDV